MIHHNNFIESGGDSSQGYDDTGSNTWDDSSEGNYWSDYNGTDSNGDGIGDIPYYIDGAGNATDRYPLMNATNTSAPEKIPEFPILPTVAVVSIVAIGIFRRRRTDK